MALPGSASCLMEGIDGAQILVPRLTNQLEQALARARCPRRNKVRFDCKLGFEMTGNGTEQIAIRCLAFRMKLRPGVVSKSRFATEPGRSNALKRPTSRSQGGRATRLLQIHVLRRCRL
jgi:hypothetical protein